MESTRVKYEDMLRLSKEIFETYDLFKGLKLVPIKTLEGMDTTPVWDFKVPGSHGLFRAYRVEGEDEIDKICVGELHYMNRAIYSFLSMNTTDDYDLPIYGCQYGVTARYTRVTTDFMPLVDICVHDEYRVKYLDPLSDIWKKYKDLPGMIVAGRRWGPWPWARAGMGPYALDGVPALPDARRKALDASIEYAKVWLKLAREAEPIKDPEYREEVLTRKRTLIRFYREREPGGEVLKKVMGELFKVVLVMIF